MNKLKKRYYPYWIILPAFFVYSLIYIFPTIIGFIYSFTDWHIAFDTVSFIGLDNYRMMFEDPIALKALKNSFIVAFTNTIFLNMIALALAVALNRRFVTGNYLKSVFFMPCILCPVILGFLFTYILAPTGMLNQLLRTVGLGTLALDWLGTHKTALYAIVAVNVWAGSGYCMVIYLSGLQGIPDELVDSARIDGANSLQLFTKIKFPLIMPAFNINLLLTMVVGFKMFDLVMVLTGGGPGTSTQVISTFIRKSFAAGQLGYGSALNVVFFVLIAGITLPLLSYLRTKEVEL